MLVRLKRCGAGANTETVKNNDMLKIILAFYYSLFIIHCSLRSK